MDVSVIVDFVSGEKGLVVQIVSLLLGGAVASPIILVLVRLLALPGIRNVIGTPAYLAGKASSLALTRWLGEAGENLEDAVQEFLVWLLNKFFSGLDHDDRSRRMKIELVVYEVDGSATIVTGDSKKNGLPESL
uniref:Uncharacterized protein n=1 Tax=viral metagenome TaxID=1070528 RepID=A0A6M3KMS8_9ZZZZ